MYYSIGIYNLNNGSLHVKVIPNDIITANISTLNFVIYMKFIVKNKGEVNHFWNDLRWSSTETTISFRLRNSRYLKSSKINLLCQIA